MKEVILSQGYVAIVDDEDFPLVSRYKWRVQKTKSGAYARAWTPMVSCKRQMVFMHRLIAASVFGESATKSRLVDHKDANTLDNRRANLRLATHSSNAQNKRPARTGRQFKGVKQTGREAWAAIIRPSGGYVSVYGFSSPEAAARHYDKLAKHYFGEFARPNFPSEAA